jgi:hypothetical protein
MKMKNEVMNTIARSKTHIHLEDEEKTKAERNDEEDRFESFIKFRSRYCKIEVEPDDRKTYDLFLGENVLKSE